MRRLIHQLSAAVMVAGIALFLPMLALSAAADIDGNCEATVKDVSVRDRGSTTVADAIDVEQSELVTVTMTSPAGFASHNVNLEYAGISWAADSATDNGDASWSETVNVDDYATYGVGLYKVVGEATLSDGSSCTGAVLIDVAGNPLATVAGKVAVGVTAVAVAGLAAATVVPAVQGQRSLARVGTFVTDRLGELATADAAAAEAQRKAAAAAHEREVTREIITRIGAAFRELRWCAAFVLPAVLLTALLFPFGAMATGGGSAPAPQPVRLPRAPWRPLISGAGLLGGLLAGAGVVVLLQQYAVVYPTRAVAIEGLVCGLALGLILPSLVQLSTVIRLNRVIARAERQLRETEAQQPPSQA